jgi:hypothetical protein
LTDAGEYYRDHNYSLVGHEPAAQAAPQVPAAPADRAELLSRLQALEQELAALKQVLAAAPSAPAPEQAAPPAVGPRRAQVPGFQERVSVGGYSEFTYADREGARGNFDMLRLVPKLSARISPKIFFGSEIEFEHLGDVEKGGEVVIEQAYLDFLVRPELNFRAGGVLAPFNQLNILHDGPLRELTDRPLVDRFIVPTTWTEPGAGIYGGVRLSPNVSVNYETYLVNGIGPGISDGNGLRDARRGGLTDNNQNKAWVGRLGVTPTPGLEVGVSSYQGKWDDANQLDLRMLGFDWSYRRGPLKVVGEWARDRVDRDAAGIAAGVPPELEGHYLEISYRLGRWTPVLHFSKVDPDTSRETRFDLRRVVLGLNYRPSGQTLLKMEWQRDRRGADASSANGLVGSVTSYF